MIKAIFFDFDGTLYSHNLKKVHDSTFKAFELLKEKGIKRVLCTGRHIRELEKLDVLNLGLEFDGYILLNGQIILDKDFKYIGGTKIRESMAKKIIDIFNNNKAPFIIETIDELYVNYLDDFQTEGLRSVGTEPFPVKPYDNKDIYQISTYVNAEKKKWLYEELDECFITSWNEYGLCIVDKDGGKSKGIEKYIQYYNYTNDETMAFGDGENDVDMIEYAKIGVAMGNGTDHLKSVADYVTEDIDNDGLYKALKHFKVI